MPNRSFVSHFRRRLGWESRVIVAGMAMIAAAPIALAQSFVNFETPQVHPLDITPDGGKLLVCNTADNRLELCVLTANGPLKAGSIPVGLEPVSVRARTANEAWVVNHVSDSISIVDLNAMNVRATIATGDEPCDVVFAGRPQRAFVSVSQLNQVRVFDPTTLAQVGSPVDIQGEDPRALATDGVNVYAAIFESGNHTTVLSREVVSSTVNPYPGDPNPPPNAGSAFVPPIASPTPPTVALIVKKVNGNWVDDNTQAGLNWNAAVTWDLHDHDVAVINAGSLMVSYITGLMNLNMNLAVRPGSQPAITVIGTEATNDRRFEPNVRGTFVRVMGAIAPIRGGSTSIVDLNPHLTYATPTIPQSQRDLSIGDPRCIDWRGDGQRAYIAGMGSNNVIVTDASLSRVASIDVEQGPTAVKFDQARGFVYVLNRFAGTISVIRDSTLNLLASVPLFDPTPAVIRIGRPHLYDTHQTSGLGQISCGSCHVDARMDQLAWDLGDPSGGVINVPEGLCMPLASCLPFHPMKGPMVTQTLVGIIGDGPMHWRGDRADLAAFSPAFVGLQGDDAPPSAQQMTEFADFIATIRFPPQPYRNFDNSLKSTALFNGGVPTLGESTFGASAMNCVSCHSNPSGTNGLLHTLNGQSIKMPHLRNQYEKTGFSRTSMSNNRGFGFNHDGVNDTIFDFLLFNQFPFANDQARRDSEAFMLSWDSGTHAAIGVQTTIVDYATIPPAQVSLIASMIGQADAHNVGLVVKGRVAGEQRGWMYLAGGLFQSDRDGESLSTTTLLAMAAPGSEQTWTVVPQGSQMRIGIDRDSDGAPDRDELDACSNPANPQETPTNVCLADTNGSHTVDTDDLITIITTWGQTGPVGALAGDIAPGCGNGVVNTDDLIVIITSWGACP